jgi:cytochrome c oxidase assembly protein Cox11
MFVNFYIDPDVSPDIKEITLAYTLFDAGKFDRKENAPVKGRISVD